MTYENIPFTMGSELLAVNNRTDSRDWVAHINTKLLGTMAKAMQHNCPEKGRNSSTTALYDANSALKLNLRPPSKAD